VRGLEQFHHGCLALLDGLATLYGKASVVWLGKAAASPAARDAAAYYLEEACALLGTGGKSARATDAFDAPSKMPQTYKDRAAVRKAADRYAAGGKGEAARIWDDFSRKQPADPDLLAEILFACDRAGCRDIVGRAAALAETGEGKRFRTLHFALGRHYLARKEYAKALFHLEAGRDKGNKNKVESTDPEMLAALAEAYYRVKKFSEAQEIYFEMSKSFPAVRQIQEALQVSTPGAEEPGDEDFIGTETFHWEEDAAKRISVVLVRIRMTFAGARGELPEATAGWGHRKLRRVRPSGDPDPATMSLRSRASSSTGWWGSTKQEIVPRALGRFGTANLRFFLRRRNLARPARRSPNPSRRRRSPTTS
jgi:hypothetical protein